MSNYLKELNKQQFEAVTHKNGPILIIAGAGTGKTKVITSRIAHIISSGWAKPSEILALTFTDKAAQEMEERVDILVPYGFVDTWISTFHSFGDRVLRDFSIDIGLPANFKILSSTEQAIFMRENLFAFELDYYRPLSNPTSHIKELLSHFSRLKDELISPDEYLNYATETLNKTKKSKDKEIIVESKKTLELANAYAKYQELMVQSGNLDYGDQIYMTYQLLSGRPDILKKLQHQFKYILVDEFQDTNYGQYQIVKKIAEDQNITVVGDDDQSIYRFRGASISNIISFKDDYPKLKQVVLNQNYRSTKQILDCAYRLIQHNNPNRLEAKNKINKKLVSLENGREVELLQCQNVSCEADKVVEKIIFLKKKYSLKNNDFAILARANNHLEPFIKTLEHKKIDHVFVGSSSLFSTEEVKVLVAFLKCLSYPDDNLSFYHLATSDIYRIDVEILAKYYSKIRRENKSFEDIFSENTVDREIREILEDLKKYRKMIGTNSVGELLYQFLKDKKYLKKLTSNVTVESESKVANIAKFFERISQFDHTGSNRSSLSFLENLELIMEVGDEVQLSDVDRDLDAVNLMSVHAAKGLEWPVVFVVNCVSDRFPSRDRREKIPVPDALIKESLPLGDYHLQEERRLFYVACTRAKEHLFFSASDDYGGKRKKKLSQFVLEALDQPELIKEKHKLSAVEKIERHAPGPDTLHPRLNLKKGDILRLSRQQIDDYFTCPKKYYYSSIIKIPLPLNWHFMYGTAIHEAIGRYYQRKIAGKKPNLNSIIQDFLQCFISEGFITREHEEQKKQKGLETLTKFFNEDNVKKIIPSEVEKPFEFFERNAKINGRYDLILKDKDGFRICDFKTSQVDGQKEADSRLKKSTQMMMYALSWQKKYGKIPKTSLIFIESDLTATTTFKEKDLEKTEEMIFEVTGGIRSESYIAKADIRQCALCPYKDICKDAKI